MSSLPPIDVAAAAAAVAAAENATRSPVAAGSPAASPPLKSSLSSSSSSKKNKKQQNGKKLWAKIQVRDVIQASPMESEAETYLQKQLEASQTFSTLGPRGSVIHDTKKDDDDPEALLSAIPRQHLDSFAQQFPTKSDDIHRGDHLFDLANQLLLNQHHQDQDQYQDNPHHTNNTANDHPFGDHHDPNVHPPTAADQLAANAAGIFLRKSANNNNAANHNNNARTSARASMFRTSTNVTAPSDKKTDQPLDDEGLLPHVVKSEEAMPEFQDEQQDSMEQGGHAGGDDNNNDNNDKDQNNTNQSNSNSNNKKSPWRKQTRYTLRHVHDDFYDFVDFVKGQRTSVWTQIKLAAWLVIPSLGFAFLCFYALGNPPCGTHEECLIKASNVTRVFPNGTVVEIPFGQDYSKNASASWWLLFLGVRLWVTLGIALLLQAVLIDFCCLRTTISARWWGSFLTLFCVQSRGWPFVAVVWGATNFMMLYGDGSFAKHWLFWQSALDIFNETNHAGEVLNQDFYFSCLIVMIVAGGVVAIKRYWLGLWLGKKTYSRYAAQLRKVMTRALLVCQVAQLSREKYKYDVLLMANKTLAKQSTEKQNHVQEMLQEDGNDENADNDDDKEVEDDEDGPNNKNDPNTSRFLGQHLSGSMQARINDLLGAFEEPETFQDRNINVAISDIIRFRQSVVFLNTSTPFSMAFGQADHRAICIANSQRVYERLVRNHGGGSGGGGSNANSDDDDENNDEPVLHFNTIAKLGLDEDDELDDEKLRKLIRLFRPDREGYLSKLDFVKSVDTVYKEIRLLRAGIANSQRVDRSFESLFHVFFYFLLGCVGLAILGLDPFALFLAVSGIIVGFAFMIGPACSQVFSGILLVLVRKPFEIGDKINVSAVTVDTPGTGSAGWLVKDVDLFTTTVSYWNGELATYSNGSLFLQRIINMNRSACAFQFFLVKFPNNTEYGKILMFRKCVEMFVKDRPREWLAFNGFRVTRVEIELGFVEYKVMMTHREKWQNLGAILDSSSEVQGFAREVCAKMGIQYQAPAMPIDLRMSAPAAPSTTRASGAVPGHSPSYSTGGVDAADLLARVQADADAANGQAADIQGLEKVQNLFKK